MPSVRGAIIELLRADAELVAMLPDDEHIYHRTAPQDSQPPFIIISKQDGRPTYTFGDHHNGSLWTVKGICRGMDSTPADDLDERIRAVLQDAELDLDGRTTLWFRFEEDVDFGELEEGAIIHHVGAMYRLIDQPD
ncbi:MAG: DUF3168 domain-containing protein [Chloroflexi bacterium]|nr:MAG: DUF3168 domain-containing protein [Chloroflexota bacterium]